jgi:hypothetical protein
METTIDDPAEAIRRVLRTKINSEATDRAGLESRHGRVWSPAEMAAEFEVLEYKAPLVVVRKRSDQKLGSLFFQHHPRFYWGYEEDKP